MKGRDLENNNHDLKCFKYIGFDSKLFSVVFLLRYCISMLIEFDDSNIE